MAYNFIDETNIHDKFKDAKAFMEPLFKPFDEFERIARNKPHPGIAKELPKVTDGTLSALIQEQPKRIIQQIPTGKVKSDNEWLDIVGGYIFEKEILPNANMHASLIQKCWALTSKALTYGAQPVFVQFVNRDDYFGTDFTLPYVKDVYLEPGKLSDRDSNVIFLRAYYQPSDIDCIIEKEERLAKLAKKRGEKYESTWDLGVLEKAKEETKKKDATQLTPNEQNQDKTSSVIEIVHVFQRGVGSTFYSFCPDLEDGENIVRRKINKDPRGAIPIHYMYANIDLSNPLGRGSVELSGGMQNLLDSEVQSYQYMRALLMNPPLEVRGNISSSILKYRPKAVWKLGTDPNASVKPVELSTSSLESFPTNYGLIKSQILNLNAGSDTSISADVGNPGFSKTPAGVDAMEQRLGVSDNYMRKQFESTFEDIAETMINLYFAERSGVQELQLDDDTALKIRKIQPDAISEDGIIMVDYDTETEKLKFEVDASTSSLKDDAAERDRLLELLDLSQKYPDSLGQIIDVKELSNRIVVLTGVEDPEKIVPSPDDVDEYGNPIQDKQQDKMTPEMVMQMIQQALQESQAPNMKLEAMKAIGLKFSDLPEDAKQQVLADFGITSQMPSPKQEELNMNKFNIAATQAGPSDVELEDRNEPGEKPEGSKADTKEDASEGEPIEPMDNLLPEFDEDDIVLIRELKKRGYSDTQIGQAVAMMKDGASNDEVLQALNGGINA